MIARQRLRAGFAAGVSLVLLNGLAAAELSTPRSTHGAAAAQSELRLDGEYGLWVRENGNQIAVSWLAREPGPGYLRVLTGNRVREEIATPSANVHTARFRRPRGAEVVLQYGAKDDPRDAHQTTLYLGAEDRRARPVVTGVDSIFVVADTHGEYDNLVRLLQNAGVIDSQQRWSAGRSHLVLLGDVFDRGPDVTRILWFLYALERQAERQRGRVHLLLGNHEIMVMQGDLRYVSPKENLIAELHQVDYSRMFDVRQSILGRWLATKPALLKIDNVLFAHGGVSPEYLPFTVPTLDDTLSGYMKEDLFYHWADSTFWTNPSNLAGHDSASVARREDFFWGENSVFWYRGYVQQDTLGAALQAVLRRFGSEMLVVGHTPTQTIHQRYGGALIAAHPRTAATEMLLLVRAGREYRKYRYGLTGPPEPLPAAASVP
ncbi:MAG TPA: metallophosphoesterase [Longimicrobiaceae bacterium]|nr:metallophosphoesterase [Longimicrobiaceae bacterium]